MIINICVAFNCVTVSLSICFEYEQAGALKYIESYVVEILFLSDFVFSFLTEYKDPESQQPVRQFTLMAKTYIFKGSFLIDGLALIPLKYLLTNSNSSFNRLLRLIRITRLMKVLDIARFNHLLKSLFENDSS